MLETTLRTPYKLLFNKFLFTFILSINCALAAQPLAHQAALPAVPAEHLPKAMAWSAYNLGTTGYNQAVAVGKVLKNNYGTTLRVVPGKNDISRLLPLMKKRVQFSANGSATYFAQEGVQQFAAPNWGPLPLRLVLMSKGDSNQAIAVAADTGIKTLGELRGKRVPYVRGAPAVNVTIEAYLACADLTWDDVIKVEFPGYGAMWNGIVNGQIDAAYATTVSGPTRKLEASPRGIFWPPVPHDDSACWERVQAKLPIIAPYFATRGAGISTEHPHEGGTYPYPLLITLADTDADLVNAVTAVMHQHYDDYKDADPGAIGWALERQVFNWVVPFHAGSIRYLRQIGVWDEDLDTYNNNLIRRQETLQTAWQAYATPTAKKLARDAFQAGWKEARASALKKAGFDPVWH